jgi:hypothetical protein
VNDTPRTPHQWRNYRAAQRRGDIPLPASKPGSGKSYEFRRFVDGKLAENPDLDIVVIDSKAGE